MAGRRRLTLENFSKGRGIELVLGKLDAGVERLGRVAGQDGDAFLRDDFPGVDVAVDEVDGAASLGHASGEGLFPRAESLEGGQERGVNVDDAVGKSGEERFLDHAHITGEDDPFDGMVAEEFDERDFAFGTELGAEGRGRERGGGESERGGPGEDDRVGQIAGDEDDPGVEFSGEDRFLDRDEVAAFAGAKNREAGGIAHEPSVTRGKGKNKVAGAAPCTGPSPGGRRLPSEPFDKTMKIKRNCSR